MTTTKYWEIYKEHCGYVSHKWVHYLFIYDSILQRFLEKGKPITFLEIGVQNGGSLEIWKKYLPPKSEIHGIDINKKCLELKFDDNVFFHLGDATDNDFMKKTFGDIEFDVVIDDGSHIWKDVIQTFEYLFPKMKPGGVYIVEDAHTSYWKRFAVGGGVDRGWGGGFIEYFKNLIDCALNGDYKCDRNTFFEKIKNKIYRHKNDVNTKSEINQMILQISFFDSICVINKFYDVKKVPFKSIVSGKVALVDNEPLNLKCDRQDEIDLTRNLFEGNKK